VNYILPLAGEKAELGRVWPHMLRHSCGHYLADKRADLRTMQDYLGHRDPKHTAHYTRVADRRFEGLWRQAATSAAICHIVSAARPCRSTMSPGRQ